MPDAELPDLSKDPLLTPYEKRKALEKRHAKRLSRVIPAERREIWDEETIRALHGYYMKAKLSAAECHRQLEGEWPGRFSLQQVYKKVEHQGWSARRKISTSKLERGLQIAETAHLRQEAQEFSKFRESVKLNAMKVCDSLLADAADPKAKHVVSELQKQVSTAKTAWDLAKDAAGVEVAGGALSFDYAFLAADPFEVVVNVIPSPAAREEKLEKLREKVERLAVDSLGDGSSSA